MWLTARKWGALPPHFQIRGAWAPLAPPVPPPMHYINLYWEPHIPLSTYSTAVNGSRKKSSCIVQTGISAVGVHLLALKYSILQHKIKKICSSPHNRRCMRGGLCHWIRIHLYVWQHEVRCSTQLLMCQSRFVCTTQQMETLWTTFKQPCMCTGYACGLAFDLQGYLRVAISGKNVEIFNHDGNKFNQITSSS